MRRPGKRSRASVTAAAPTIEMCGIRVAETLFGIPVSHVIEILGHQATRTVPLAPSFISGLVHYRGDVLTTISLRHLLDLPPLARPQDILVLDGPSGQYGLVVDAVREVLTVAQSDFEPNPTTLDDRRKALFAGTYKLPTGLLVMLDIVRLDPMQLADAEAA